MELKDFIKAALADITDAVKESQQELSNGAVVCPPTSLIANDAPEKSYIDICFDVMVVAGASDNKQKGLGIQVMGMGVGFGSNGQMHSEQTSRLSFSIPLQLPGQS